MSDYSCNTNEQYKGPIKEKVVHIDVSEARERLMSSLKGSVAKSVHNHY